MGGEEEWMKQRSDTIRTGITQRVAASRHSPENGSIGSCASQLYVCSRRYTKQSQEWDRLRWQRWKLWSPLQFNHCWNDNAWTRIPQSHTPTHICLHSGSRQTPPELHSLLVKKKQKHSTDSDWYWRLHANRLLEVFELVISINHTFVFPSSDQIGTKNTSHPDTFRRIWHHSAW